jgi:hypothetical protein
MGFKRLKELAKHLVFSLLAGFHIWMMLGIVALSDIVDVQLAWTILVHQLEGSHCQGLSCCVHPSSDWSQEFIVTNLTWAVSVEDLEGLLALLWRQVHPEIRHCLFKLICIKSSWSVVVGYLELLADTLDSSGTSCFDLWSNVLNQLSLSCIYWDSWIHLCFLRLNSILTCPCLLYWLLSI